MPPCGATYSYLANSPLVEQIAFANSGAQRMATTKQYDYLNRLTSISSVPPGASAVSFNYAYNSANQRTAVTNADNSRWAFGYDSLGQVTSGRKYWSDNQPVAGEQFEYVFDTIGNRRTASSGGDEFGTSCFSPNLVQSAITALAGFGGCFILFRVGKELKNKG